MKYVIMCGGNYKDFELPKAMSDIGGEWLVNRTIRQLRKYGASDICISSNDERFDACYVTRLEHTNSFVCEKGKSTGYWLDAFYPHFSDDTKVTFIFGDVVFTDDAIKTIVETQTDKNILFGTSAAKNEKHANWGEPFAYIVNDYKTFMDGVKAVKKLQDEGKTKRVAIVWELYRYLNGFDVNVQRVTDDTYICIDDGTMDIDAPFQIKQRNEEFS